MPVSGSSISRMPPVFALVGRILPLLPLQPALVAVLYEVRRRHPRIFDRLGSHAAKRYGLDPTDLPFAFVLEPRQNNPVVRATRTLPRELDVRITGPLSALIGLANGSCDGDALFFSRDIQIEGDMEAAIALRNAIDAEEVDIVVESVAWMGPFSTVAERLLRRVICDQPGWPLGNPVSERGSWN
jgi:predicted lipid carrier protein YhbT